MKLHTSAKDADALMALYAAASERIDGSRVVLILAAEYGTSPFGPVDTVRLTKSLAPRGI